MTALTINFEDKQFAHLKKRAEKVGCSVNNYILYLISKTSDETLEENEQDSVDLLLDSMQFHSGMIPITENGKGVLAQDKYL